MNVGRLIVVNRPSFDNAQSHVTAFRPISEAARSWSDDKKNIVPDHAAFLPDMFRAC